MKEMNKFIRIYIGKVERNNALPSLLALATLGNAT
jgi:hypothetical protein